MDTQLMRSLISQIQEAYEGEITINQNITRNLQQYGREASRMELAGRDPLEDYAKIKTAADLMKVLDAYVIELSDKNALQQGPALTLLSKLKAQNLKRTAQQLDQVAKMPAPDQEK